MTRSDHNISNIIAISAKERTTDIDMPGVTLVPVVGQKGIKRNSCKEYYTRLIWRSAVTQIHRRCTTSAKCELARVVCILAFVRAPCRLQGQVSPPKLVPKTLLLRFDFVSYFVKVGVND